MKKKLNHFLRLVMFLLPFVLLPSCSVSDDDDEQDWRKWQTADESLCLDVNMGDSWKADKAVNIPVNYDKMTCYVDGKYYHLYKYSKWLFITPKRYFVSSTSTNYFYEKDGLAYVILNSESTIQWRPTFELAFQEGCTTRVPLGVTYKKDMEK